MADTPDTRDPKGAPAPYRTTTPEATLRATYTREQPYRHHWPKDYETGMADPIIARVVDMLARRQVTAFGRRKADRWAPGRALAPGEIDRKRAASGDIDRDDDK